MSKIKECPHHKGPNIRSGHFVHGVCEECIVERWLSCNELVDIKDRQLSLQKEGIERLVKVGNLLHDFCGENHPKKSCEWTEALAFVKEKLG